MNIKIKMNCFKEIPSVNVKQSESLLCFYCGNDIQLKKLDKKGQITIYCGYCEQKNQNGLKQMPLNDYVQKLKNYTNRFNNCHVCSKKITDENEYKFCTKCQISLCSECSITHINDDKHGFKEEYLMNFKDTKNKCLKHNKPNICFCFNHQIHYCNLCCKDHKNCKKKMIDEDIIEAGDVEKFNNKQHHFEQKKQELVNETKIKIDNFEKLKKIEIDKENNNLKEEIGYIKNEEIQQLKNNKEKFDTFIQNLKSEYDTKLNENELQIKTLKDDHARKQEEINKDFEEKKNNAKKELESEINRIKKKYANEKSKLDNDNKIYNIKNQIQLLKLIKKTYEKNPDNYYSRKNYEFASNNFTDIHKL